MFLLFFDFFLQFFFVVFFFFAVKKIRAKIGDGEWFDLIRGWTNKFRSPDGKLLDVRTTYKLQLISETNTLEIDIDPKQLKDDSSGKLLPTFTHGNYPYS